MFWVEVWENGAWKRVGTHSWIDEALTQIKLGRLAQRYTRVRILGEVRFWERGQEVEVQGG